MKTSVDTLRFLLILGVIFFLLSYGISLNEENKYLVLDSPWISNNFVFAIAGGAFASLLVIIASEIQKYFIIKRQLEDSIYCQLVSLYMQIITINYNIKRQMNDIKGIVPMNLIDDIANRGQLCLNNLASIDYTPFGKSNSIKMILSQYNGKNGNRIRSFFINSVFLKMAINEDSIDSLRQGRNELVTASAPKTNNVLRKIYKDSNVVLTYVEKSIEVIVKECKNRYHWDDVKKSIISTEQNFVTTDLESFIKLPHIQLNL